MFVINLMWLIAPISLGVILFLILVSKLFIKSKKLFFSFFFMIVIYIAFAFACYYIYDLFFKNQYISLLISLTCIGLGAVVNLIMIYLGITSLKKKESKDNLLQLQYSLEKNIQVEDKYLNILFSYSSDRWTMSDIKENLFSELEIDNFDGDNTEVIEINKDIRFINDNYKFLKKNLRRKYFFLKNLKSVTNLENEDEIKKILAKKKIEFSISKETEKTIEIIKILSNELLNLVRLEENEKTKNREEDLAGTINHMEAVLYNQLRVEKSKIKDEKLAELYSYVKAEKVLLEKIEEVKDKMYNYIYQIKRKLRDK